MIRALKAEFLKLFTVRSTYVVGILATLLILLMSFYFEGIRGNTGSAASTLGTTALHEITINTAGAVAVFVVIIAILLMAHEFRYNTISYTLTANTSRTKVLLAKTSAMIIFGTLFGMAAVAFSIGVFYAGLNIRGAELPVQDFNILYHFGKVAFYFAAYALVGLLLAILLKSIVGAIAFFFIVPISVESLLGIVLKDNSAYLPFTMLDSILGNGIIQSQLSTTRILLFSLGYVVIAWLISWVVFVRRDAN